MGGLVRGSTTGHGGVTYRDPNTCLKKKNVKHRSSQYVKWYDFPFAFSSFLVYSLLS
jgi:hypothetical protein